MYAGVLEHALVKDATGELHVTAIQALLEVASDSPEQYAELYRGQLSWLRSFLTHTDATGKPAIKSHAVKSLVCVTNQHKDQQDQRLNNDKASTGFSSFVYLCVQHDIRLGLVSVKSASLVQSANELGFLQLVTLLASYAALSC